jgi:hypothetical protein
VSKQFQAQEVWLHGQRYLLLEGGSIVAENWSGELGYAHLNDDGRVTRYGEQIARISDMQFGNVVTIDLSIDRIAGMIDTVLS